MAIKIASWNIEGRLHGYQKSGRGTAAHILKSIAALEADVLVLPEFHMNSLASGVEAQLKGLGYEIFETAYADVGRDKKEQEKWGEVHIGVLSRLPVTNVEIIRPGGLRNLLVCFVTDPENGKQLRVVATHLEDRTEAMRIKQADALAGIINKTAVPTVVLGDFNAMWKIGRARLFNSRSAWLLAKSVPLTGLRSVATRVVESAEGSALELLALRTNLREADLRHRPTTTPKMRDTPFLPSIRLIQIDHMLVSPEVHVGSFTVHTDGGSDHRAISATLAIDRGVRAGQK